MSEQRMCFCVGCRHATNCRCRCPECNSPEALAAEAERNAIARRKWLEGQAAHAARRGIKKKRGEKPHNSTTNPEQPRPKS